MKKMPLSKKLPYVLTAIIFVVFSVVMILRYKAFDSDGNFTIAELLDVFNYYYPIHLIFLLLTGVFSFFYLSELLGINSVDREKTRSSFLKLSLTLFLLNVFFYFAQFLLDSQTCNDEACGGLAIIMLFGIPAVFLCTIFAGFIISILLKLKVHSKVFILVCLITNLVFIATAVKEYPRAVLAYKNAEIGREYLKTGNVELCFEQKAYLDEYVWGEDNFTTYNCYDDAATYLSNMAFADEDGEICKSKEENLGKSFTLQCYIELKKTIKESALKENDPSYCAILGQGFDYIDEKSCRSELSSEMNMGTWTVPL